MAVTTAQIRDLLNRPRGLNEGTINEYITIRTAEVNKKTRQADLFGVTDTYAPDTTVKESAIKFLVCVDCLRVLIDTIPAVVPERSRVFQIFDTTNNYNHSKRKQIPPLRS